MSAIDAKNRAPMTDDAAHDVVAIGCGPFNLGLVALASTLPAFDLVAFEARPEMRWHSGIMFDDAMLQSSFLADLVTLIDPTHPLSFLAYLRDVDRMYSFFVREELHPTRREYESYLRWAAAKLPAARFGHTVERVEWDGAGDRFVVSATTDGGRHVRVRARDLVVGVGTEAALPPALADVPAGQIVHSGEYLHRRDEIGRARHVTVVGSGQSGAEVALDLLRKNLDGGAAVTWITRTASFAPLDYTKLVLEMTTPDYVRYFHGLPQATRDRLVADQWRHYKGISSKTLEQIHDVLYQRELRAGLAAVELRCGVAVEDARPGPAGDVVLGCRHVDTASRFTHRTSLVVAATGYRQRRMAFLAQLEPMLRRDAKGRLEVGRDHALALDPSVRGRVFVANADLHSHGVTAPDLGFCAYRNATILNAILRREAYRLPSRTAFTRFGAPTPAAALARAATPPLRAESPWQG